MVVIEALLKLWHQQGQRVLLFSQSRAVSDFDDRLTFFRDKSIYEKLILKIVYTVFPPSPHLPQMSSKLMLQDLIMLVLILHIIQVRML